MIEEIQKNDLIAMGIKGQVLSVKEKHFDFEGGDEIFDFLEESKTYHFDKFGNIVQESTEYASLIGEAPVIIKTKIEYNDKGLATQKTSSNSREAVGINQYSYDYNGNMISIRKLFGNGNLNHEIRFVYNEQNQCIEAAEYSRKVAPIDSSAMYEEAITPNYKEEYKYDQNGHLITEEEIENEEFQESFEYDMNGNWIVKTIHEYGENTSKIVREINYV